MKTKFIIAILFAFIFLSAFEAIPVHNAVTCSVKNNLAQGFSFFRTHRQGKNGVTATWGVQAGSAVASFYVERTYEDPADPYANWETCAYVPCLGEKSFKATDINVFPGFISYRVVAVLPDGSEFVSDISTVHIVSH
ncbi:MAG: hypothetical protein IPH18_09160 [Chitinophagaceae bacterium]|nr:hypothetical protein [Chitinophagaceae bacterium]